MHENFGNKYLLLYKDLLLLLTIVLDTLPKLDWMITFGFASLCAWYLIAITICISGALDHEKLNCKPVLICHILVESLFETMQTLFWAAFGIIDMRQFSLLGIDDFTKFAAKTILGTYAVITIVVLLNLLIAMLNNSYQLISVSIWISAIYLSSIFFTQLCLCTNNILLLPTIKVENKIQPWRRL